MEALHYLNSPAHAKAQVEVIYGVIRSLHLSGQDDPLLYAYELTDSLPPLFGAIVDLWKWAQAVTEATPDQIFETGALLTRKRA